VENWNWYDPQKAERSFPKAIRKAQKYLRKHMRISRRLNKPFVLEEFGLARDGGSYETNSTTEYRDQYFDVLFSQVLAKAKEDQASAAINIWSWAGEGRPREPRAIWKAGDDFTGDPPFEHQGWYSVYDTDESTLSLLRKYSLTLNSKK